MKRGILLLIATLALAAIIAALGFAAAPGEHEVSACGTATAVASVPDVLYGDGGTRTGTIPGATSTATKEVCVTATATDTTTPGPTTTVFTSPPPTTAPTTTASPPPPPPPPPNSCTATISPGQAFPALGAGAVLCLHGGSYAGGYTVSASGTSTSRITVQSYPGETATIAGPAYTCSAGRCSGGNGITVNGNYVRVTDLTVDGPLYGISVPGDNDEIDHNTVKHAGYGIASELSSDAINVHDNNLIDNNAHIVDDNTAGSYSAVSVHISGSNGLFTHNTVTGGWTTDQYYGHDGSAFEIWRANGNTISYNYGRSNESFAELGHSSGTTSNNNHFIYNVAVVDLPFASTGFYQHGADSFGPMTGTQLYHNSIYVSAPSTNAMGCSPSCTATAQTIRDNAIKCVGTTNGVSFGPGEDYDDISGCGIWGGSVLGSHSKIADPLFVSTTNLDTQATSPARNMGTSLGLTPDFAGTPVPQGLEDAGAYEH